MSGFIATPGPCVLEKVQPEDFTLHNGNFKLNIFEVPFFSFYQCMDFGIEQHGPKWMTVYKMDKSEIYYIRQYKTQSQESSEQIETNKNTVFLPHFWNVKYNIAPTKKIGFVNTGDLTVYKKDGDNFINLKKDGSINYENGNRFKNEIKPKIKPNILSSKLQFDNNFTYDYNSEKKYTIHGEGETNNSAGQISDMTQIPNEIMELIKEGQLFVTFKWNNNNTGLILEPTHTFYGIYEFVDVDANGKPMFKSENTDIGDVYLPNFEYTKDFEKQYPQNKVTEADKTEICKLMQQFMDKVKPQGKSVAGSKFAFPPLSTSMPGANANLNPMPPQPPTKQNNIIKIATQMFENQDHYGESISKQEITTTDLLDVTKCYYWNESDNGTNTTNNGRVTQTHADALTKFNERRKILFESDFFIVVAPHPTEKFPCVYVFSKSTTNANYTKIKNLKNNVEMLEIKDQNEIDKSKILGDKSVSIDGYSILHIFCRHYGDDATEYAEDTDFKRKYLPQYKSNNGPNWVDLLVNLVPELFDKIAFVESTAIDYIKNSHDVINSYKSNSILTDLIAAKPNLFIEYTLNISIFWTAMINDNFPTGTYVYVYDAINDIKTQIKIGKADKQVKVLLFEISKDATLKYSTLYYCEKQIDNANCEHMFLYNGKRPLPQFTGTARGTRSNVKKTTKEIPLYELNDIDSLYLQIKNIKHVPLLGKHKMVATFDSTAGGEPDNNFIRDVKPISSTDLSSLEKKVNEWIKKTKGDNIDFKIYIDDSWTEGSGVSSGAASKLVFYSNKYLTQLATLSGKSVKELLKLCTTQQTDGTFDYELVIIAFNFGGDIKTEKGKNLFEEYKTQYGEYKSDTIPIKISPTLGPKPVPNLGPTSISTLGSTSGPPSGSNLVSTSGSNLVSTSSANPVLNLGSTSATKNKIIIGVIFKDMIPEEVNVVYSIPTGSTVEKIDDYVDKIANGSVNTRDDETVYFELTEKDETEMADLISKI